MNRPVTLLLAPGALLLSGGGGAGGEHPGPPTTHVKQESVTAPPPARQAPAPVPEALRTFCTRPGMRASAQAPTRGTRIEFQPVFTGSSFVLREPLRCVVRTPEELKDLLAAYRPAEAESITPELFVDGMLLVASMGEQDSSGFFISITSVDLRGGEIIATVRSDGPSERESVTMGLEQPLALVRIPRSSAPVRFYEH